MGYDFEAKETGIFTIEVRSRSNTCGCSVTIHDYFVKKGEKYYIEYGGVDIKER